MEKKKELAYSRALVPIRNKKYLRVIISVIAILCLILVAFYFKV